MPKAGTIRLADEIPRPSKEGWAMFVNQLRLLRELREQNYGKPDTADSLVQPLIALSELIHSYEPPLIAAIDQLILAVNGSLTGNLHPLFKSSQAHWKGDEECLVMAAAGLLVRELVDSKKARTKAAAYRVVFSIIQDGGRPRPEGFSAEAVGKWDYALRHWANRLAHRREKPDRKDIDGTVWRPPDAALKAYCEDIPIVGADARIEWLKGWLGHGTDPAKIVTSPHS